MANVSGSDFTNNLTNVPTEGKPRNVALKNAGFIITIIINNVTCPLTVLLNVLVIIAVKRRPRLQSNTNILLACLAVTDALTGLVVQPSFILWKTFQLLDITEHDSVRQVHNSSLRALSVCSCLHLMLVTCERLIAIKFTTHYPFIVIKRNIKVAVISFWTFVISCEILRRIKTDVKIIFNLSVAVIILSCILFILISYVILYREALRHQKMIKTQQLPKEEVERFVKESKALKTTVLIVGTVMLCFLPMPFGVLITASVERWYHLGLYKIIYVPPYIRTFGMLNSLFNPLIYCWRQKELRQFALRRLPRVVAPTIGSLKVNTTETANENDTKQSFH